MYRSSRQSWPASQEAWPENKIRMRQLLLFPWQTWRAEGFALTSEGYRRPAAQLDSFCTQTAASCSHVLQFQHKAGAGRRGTHPSAAAGAR